MAVTAIPMTIAEAITTRLRPEATTIRPTIRIQTAIVRTITITAILDMARMAHTALITITAILTRTTCTIILITTPAIIILATAILRIHIQPRITVMVVTIITTTRPTIRRSTTNLLLRLVQSPPRRPL